MNTLKVIINFFVGAALACSFIVNCSAREWNGIKPLLSTRQDVVRRLGIKVGNKPFEFYEYQGQDIAISYALSECDSIKKQSWKVPKDTVLDIIVFEKRPIHRVLAELNLDLTKFTKRFKDFADEIEYCNEEDGFEVIALGGFIESCRYFASKTVSNQFTCKPQK